MSQRHGAYLGAPQVDVAQTVASEDHNQRLNESTRLRPMMALVCITTATFSVFHIAASRSREVLEKLVGPDFSGYLNFDYFSANCSFAWNHWIKAQYCWAHLIRDIRFLSEKHPDRKTKAWPEALLDRSRRLFSAWHRRDEMTPEGIHRSMLTHRDRFLELVGRPPKTKEAAHFAARFKIVEYREEGSDQIQTYDCSDDYFRFMFTQGVEPTNNHNEQQLRHSVIDRRITQGTRGQSGATLPRANVDGDCDLQETAPQLFHVPPRIGYRSTSKTKLAPVYCPAKTPLQRQAPLRSTPQSRSSSRTRSRTRESAGINRLGVANEKVVRERSSQPLGPEPHAEDGNVLGAAGARGTRRPAIELRNLQRFACRPPPGDGKAIRRAAYMASCPRRGGV